MRTTIYLLTSASLSFWLSAIPFALGDSAFPQGSCNNKACDLSPYQLRWSNASAGESPFCFHVHDVVSTCSPDPKQCCSLFEQTLSKIVITTYPACITNQLVVTVNGIRKNGGIYFDALSSSTAQVRLTDLGLSLSNVTQDGGVTLCFLPPSPCSTIETFCGPVCQYSVYDAARHLCCPTCPFLDPLESPPFLSLPVASPHPPPHTPLPVASPHPPPPPPLPVSSPHPPPLPVSSPHPPPLPVSSPHPPPLPVESPPPTSYSCKCEICKCDI